MSHKVTFTSTFTNPDLVASALTLSKYSFDRNGNNFRITSGPFSNATIDADTGTITGDSDYKNHKSEAFAAFRQTYSEAEFVTKAKQTGVDIESREVLKNGTIRLRCATLG